MPKLVPIYIEILTRLKDLGAEWVQMDEPYLCMDLNERHTNACQNAYKQIHEAVPGLKIMVATYFESLRDNAETAYGLPVDGLHLDLRRGRARGWRRGRPGGGFAGVE